MSDWEEVKRLAADLQKAQLSTTLQRLSERNCVEIVTLLIESNLLHVIFTNDGKEYLTPDELVREIRSELYVRGGRVNLVELSKALCVDLTQITAYSSEVQKSKDVHLVLGQLIDDTYIARIAGEINERLIQNGKVSVNDLTVLYDLPSEFLRRVVIEKQLGKLINAKQDPNDSRLFYTEAFAARIRSVMKGALAALTVPTPVTAVLNQCGLPESTFFMLFDKISAAGIVTSKQAGAQYVPHIYLKSQADWVNNFYRQNRYLEFDALSRLGIADPKTYIKRQFPNENLTTLNSCVISQSIVDQVEGALEECIVSKSFVDVQSLLPSVFNDDDLNVLIDSVLTSSKKKETITFGYCVLSAAYIESLSKPCEESVKELAKSAVESGTYQEYFAKKQISSRSSLNEPIHALGKSEKRDERRKKAAGGKTGGGTQGRETKTKSIKKHNRSKNVLQYDSDDEAVRELNRDSSLQLVTVENVKEAIEARLEEDGISELTDDIAKHLQQRLNDSALKVAADLHTSSASNSASSRRQTHAALQERLNVQIGDVRLFEKGAKHFPLDAQQQLDKYLLKSLCADIAGEILLFVAAEYELNVNNVSSPLTNDQRIKIANDSPQEHRTKLQALVKSLSGQSVDAFLTAAEDSLSTCSMILKKVDKKKDRLLILNHKHTLLDKLDQCEDPALVLHITVLVLFTAVTQNMLHASGRHVSTVIAFLSPRISPEQTNKLITYHDLVTKYLTGNIEKASIALQLNSEMESIKEIARSMKKNINPT